MPKWSNKAQSFGKTGLYVGMIYIHIYISIYICISGVRFVWCGNKNGLNIFQFVMHFPATWAATTIMNNSLHNSQQAVPMKFLDRLPGVGIYIHINVHICICICAYITPPITWQRELNWELAVPATVIK